MCTHKKWIINSSGRRVFVPCGHCKACKQEKANRVAKRIQSQEPCNSPSPFDVLFCNLTYRNYAVPYILLEDVQNFISYGDPLPVYRDSVCRYVWNPHTKTSELRQNKYVSEEVTRIYKDEVSDYQLQDFFDNSKFQTIKYKVRHGKYRSDSSKVSVCLTCEAQNFFKRLKQILHRDGHDFPLQYFYCTEYGETTCRSHLHTLIYAPKGTYDIVAKAVVKAWPFMDSNDWQLDSEKFSKIQRAVKPSHYLASYCNSPSVVPLFFQRFRPFSPNHAYSQGFGMVFYHFQQEEIRSRFLGRNFIYNEERIGEDGVPSIVAVSFPKYVISRFFPRFKGYCNLTPSEIYECARRPLRVYSYAQKLKCDYTEAKAIVTMIRNKRKFWPFLTDSEFAEMYSDIWSIWTLNNLFLFYQEQNTLSAAQICEQYDNIVDSLSFQRDGLGAWYLRYRDSVSDDPNTYAFNVERTKYLSRQFDETCKSKRAKNAIYSDVDKTL